MVTYVHIETCLHLQQLNTGPHLSMLTHTHAHTQHIHTQTSVEVGTACYYDSSKSSPSTCPCSLLRKQRSAVHHPHDLRKISQYHAQCKAEYFLQLATSSLFLLFCTFYSMQDRVCFHLSNIQFSCSPAVNRKRIGLTLSKQKHLSSCSRSDTHTAGIDVLSCFPVPSKV